MPTRKERIVAAAKQHLMEDSAVIEGTTVPGQFRRPYIETDDFEGYQPVFFCASADLPAGVKQKTAIAVNGVNYTVAGLEPDGNGFMNLPLIES